MSGRVPPSSRAHAKSRRELLAGYKRAAQLIEAFTGHDAETLGTVRLPKTPRELAVIGELDGVLYTTVRDGEREKYVHEFASKDKPLLCVTPDGRNLFIVSGRYVFTERGIVDLSDAKNLPPEFKRRGKR